MTMNQKANNRQNKFKFNIVDLFIIILVVLCVLGIAFRSRVASWIGIEKELKEYEITFSVAQAKSTSGKYLTSGLNVYMDNGVALGTLGECSSLPARTYLADSDGNLNAVTYPKDTYIDITGSITCQGITNEDGFYLGGTYSISPGMVMNMHTDMADFVITVIGISEIK